MSEQITSGPGSWNGYSTNPNPQSGSGIYGEVPGAIAVPPSIWEQTNAAVPQMKGLTDNTAKTINQYLQGWLPSSNVQQLQDASAAYGVSSGMPGSGFSMNNSLRSLGVNSLALQQQGIQDYLSFLSGTGSQQIDPSLVASIASRNALMKSAPNPTKAGQYLEKLAKGSNPNPSSGSINFGGGYGGGGFGGFGSQDYSGFKTNPGTYTDWGSTQVLYGPGGGPGAGYIQQPTVDDYGSFNYGGFKPASFNGGGQSGVDIQLGSNDWLNQLWDMGSDSYWNDLGGYAPTSNQYSPDYGSGVNWWEDTGSGTFDTSSDPYGFGVEDWYY